MADFNFNITEGLINAFPSIASKPIYKIEGDSNQGDPLAGQPFSVGELPSLPADQLMSHLGTPVMFPITFKGGLYDFYNSGKIEQRSLPDFMLPFTAIAEFNRSKDLTKTMPNGQNGSVKELWAFSDWEILIRGLILPENPDEFPTDIMETLYAYERAADSIEVIGTMFNQYDINRLVIERMSIAQVKGKPNVIPFQLNCSSDEDLENIITRN